MTSQGDVKDILKSIFSLKTGPKKKERMKSNRTRTYRATGQGPEPSLPEHRPLEGILTEPVWWEGISVCQYQLIGLTTIL